MDVLDEIVAESAKVLLSCDSTLAQKILIDEAVSIVDGASFEGLVEALRVALGTVISNLLTENETNASNQNATAFGVLQMISPR